MNTNVGPGSERRSIDEILETARSRLQRVTPEQLDAERAAGALIIDIRPIEQRQRDGECPGAVAIDRNVLEWRLDPMCAHHITDVTDHDLRIVIVCNEGYGSSLAAAFLQDLGLHRATDLVGGFQAWLAFGSQPSATARTSQASDPSNTTGLVEKTRPAPRSRGPVDR
jgi:rhodanese-related sulfurtransferase